MPITVTSTALNRDCGYLLGGLQKKIGGIAIYVYMWKLLNTRVSYYRLVYSSYIFENP